MRTQVDLKPEQHARAKAKAAALGLTLAEYVRRLVERDLAGAEPTTDPSVIFALGDSGGSDIAGELAAASSARGSAKTALIAAAVERQRDRR